MTIYEIINPSDACTIEAPDDRTAIAAITLLGHGQYGITAEDGRKVCGLSLFGGVATEIADTFLPGRREGWTKADGDFMEAAVKALVTWANENKPAMVAAFDSFTYGDAGERAFLAEAMAQAKDPARVKAAHADRRRSSMNNIGQAAAAWADRFRAVEPGP